MKHESDTFPFTIVLSEQETTRIYGPRASVDGTSRFEVEPVDRNSAESAKARAAILDAAESAKARLERETHRHDGRDRYFDGGSAATVIDLTTLAFGAGASISLLAFLEKIRPWVEIWLSRRDARLITVRFEIDGRTFEFQAADATEARRRESEIRRIAASRSRRPEG